MGRRDSLPQEAKEFLDYCDAIAAEKKIKGWSRNKKIDLINSMNPSWLDLSAE